MSDPHNASKKFVRRAIVILYAIVGFSYTMVEIISYIFLYYYITFHNNNAIANGVLDASVIRMRNRANAISLTGLFAGWLMEVWYIVFVGFLSATLDSNLVREVSTVLKYYEFYLIPLVQIHSSPPIKRFMMAFKNK